MLSTTRRYNVLGYDIEFGITFNFFAGPILSDTSNLDDTGYIDALKEATKYRTSFNGHLLLLTYWGDLNENPESLRCRGMRELAQTPATAYENCKKCPYIELDENLHYLGRVATCLLYTSPSPRDGLLSRMPSSA